jgi:23S rRNA (adenine2503-C2)-methyltransferase
MGFVRHLRAEEIVWQVFAARFILRRPVDNVVFMGMGEPLDNLEAVAQAIRILREQRGFDIACNHITLSTAGHVDGIRALPSLGFRNLRLAVSLNTADEDLRDRLMPINRRYPLAQLKQSLLDLPRRPRDVILIEYVLMAGVNDRQVDALQMARYLSGLAVRVNLIGLNGGTDDAVAPAQEHIRRFADWLSRAGLFVRIRPSRGQGVMAACGQLGSTVRS